MIKGKPACCFTGHRIISSEDVLLLKELLLLEILRKYRENNIKNFIVGGALGFDTIAGFVTLQAKKYYDDINLHMFLPCKNQDEKWFLNDRVRYERLISLADNTIYLSQDYTKGCMHKRNRAMVDNSLFCISYYKNRPGGTKYTIDYARKKNLDIVNMATQIDNSIII